MRTQLLLLSFLVVLFFAAAGVQAQQAALPEQPQQHTASERLVVFEIFNTDSAYGQGEAAGFAVNQLAVEYGDQPVVFLEYDSRYLLGNRLYRWSAAFEADVAALPMAMVSSGQQLVDGSNADTQPEFHELYQAMVEAERPRPPEAVFEAYQQRVGDRLVVNAWITNQSAVTLGPAVDAAVSALVYEENRVLYTDRFVHAAPYRQVEPALAPGATGAFQLETEPLSGVDWGQMHAVVLVDYRPSSGEAYDMLQAAYAQLATFTLAPERLTFFVDEEGAAAPGPVPLRLRGVYDSWAVVESPDWLAVVPAGGSFADVPMVSVGSGPFPAGWQAGEIELALTGAAGESWTVPLPVAVFQGTVYQAYLPTLE
jgi:hypothetical protein